MFVSKGKVRKSALAALDLAGREKGQMRLKLMGVPAFKSILSRKVITDAEFNQCCGEWVRKIKSGEYTLDRVADQAYAKGHPLSLRHLKALASKLNS